MKTYSDARAQIPVDADWSCSFGYAGKGGYVEHWYDRPTGQRYVITNGPWWDGNDWQAGPDGVAGYVLTRGVATGWPSEPAHPWLWHGMFQPFEDAAPIEILMADFACWSIA